MTQYGFEIGDSVFHIKDVGGMKGVVFEIDADHDLGDVTTCRVAWGAKDIDDALKFPRSETDVQWTNKLIAA